MIKVYFQVPNICNQITRQMKQNILWDVDRTNDVTRLRDYFRRVDDLYFDMKYQEWIQSNSFTMLVKRVGSICDIFYLGNVLLINILLLTYFRWRDPLENGQWRQAGPPVLLRSFVGGVSTIETDWFRDQGRV